MQLMCVGFVAMVVLAVGGGSVFGEGGAEGERGVRGIEFRLGEWEAGEGLVAVAGGERAVYMHAEAVIVGEDVVSAAFDREEGGFVGVEIVVDAAGGERLGAATGGHVGRPMVILLDGVVVAVPVVKSAISDSARFTGDFTDDQLVRMFRALVVESGVRRGGV